MPDDKQAVREAVKQVLEMTHDRGLRASTVKILVDAELAKAGTTEEQFERDLENDGCNSGRD